MDLFKIMKSLEVNEEIHLARLMILLGTFDEREGKTEIEGLTKLAKLDFLLRYPQYLEKALLARGKSIRAVQIQEYERSSVESKMVRYKYGPWDFRYKKFINLLIGRRLVYHKVEGKTVRVGLTDKGREVFERFRQEDTFEDLVRRSKLLRSHFDLTATNLMKFVYQTFPEIGSLDLGEEIKP